MLAGAFVVIEPFLGFPTRWDTVLLFMVGVFVIALGIVVRRRGTRLDLSRPPMRDPHFVEATPAHGAEPMDSRDENKADGLV